MSKYEECLKELDDSVPEYIKEVGKFQFENEDFEVTNHYFASQYQQCQVCGHYPIVEVFEITSKSRTLKVGNECIDNISNQKISEWFKHYHDKRKNIEENQDLINSIDSLLGYYRNGTLTDHGIYISSKGIERLQKTLDRMCMGYKPLQKNIDLYEYYRKKIVRIVKAERP